MDDETVLAVVPHPGAPPLEVSLYPLDDEWDCECGSAVSPCEHVVAAAIASQEAAKTKKPLQTLDALLERFPVAPKPKPKPEPEPEPPRSEAPERRPAAPPASRERRRAAEPTVSPRSRRRQREPVRHIAPPATHRRPRPVRYVFEPSHYGLSFSRVVDYGGDVVTLERRLTGEDEGGDRPVATTAVDLLVQDALDAWGAVTVLPREHAAALLGALADAEDVRLGDRRVTTSAEPVALIAALEGAPGDKLRLSVHSEPAADELFYNGLCRVGDVLRPLDDGDGLSSDELRRLQVGETFSREDIYELVVHTLPELERRIPVRITAERFPAPVLSEPRPAVYVTVEGGALTAEGRVVYGDPIIGMVVRNRMIVVGDAVPIREPEEERPAAREIHQALGLIPGIAKTFQGAEAARFARRLARWEADADDCEIVGDAWRALADD